MSMEDALKQLAERLAGVENALMQACLSNANEAHRLSTTPIWKTQGRVLLLRHRQGHEQNFRTAVLSRSWTNSGRSELAGTTGLRYCEATC